VLWSVQPNARLINENDPVINMEMAEITQTMAEERQAAEAGSFKMILKEGPQRFRTRTLLAMGGQMMQQLSGVNLITYVRCFGDFFSLMRLMMVSSTTLSSSRTLSACRITWPS